MVSTSCGFAGKTLVITPPKPNTTPPLQEGITQVADVGKGAYVGTGIYPAGYQIGDPSPYVKGYTLDMEFEIYNGLPYPSPATLTIIEPSPTTMRKRDGFTYWDETPIYVNVVDDGEIMPAYGSKKVIVRLYVPAEIDPPSKWIYWINYLNEGQLWGIYKQTLNNNFIFYPPSFEVGTMGDSWQELSLLTWGNSPRIMMRSKYGSPPETISDGDVVFLGLGEQVIRKWLDPDSGKILDRQYSLYSIVDNQQLSNDGGDLLFYRAWVEHRGVDGQPDGTWDAMGQNLYVERVNAEVQITMR